MNKDELNHLLQKNVIVIYDGVCGLCNKTVQVILSKKPAKKLKFVSSQSKLGEQFFESLNIHSNIDSIIVIENSIFFKKSRAFFTVLKYLKSPYKNLYFLRLLPTVITDFIYDIIAKNRYLLLGKTDECRIISKKEKNFFLD